MPTISMFFGIIIRIYLGKSEHNPPHFHAYYQDAKGVFDIVSCGVKEGDLPRRQIRLIGNLPGMVKPLLKLIH